MEPLSSNRQRGLAQMVDDLLGGARGVPARAPRLAETVDAKLAGGIPQRQSSGTIQRPGARSPLHPTDDLIVRIAREEGADDLLPTIRAIGRQETGNNPVRTSVQDARGYFQIIPPTYKAMMGTLDGIEDPEQNTRAAVRYIRHLSRKVGNNPELIAAGYFSGEGNVTAQGIRRPERRDANGKRVSDYAREVVARIEPQ
ncbi:MAG: lytic transglycosylase domain-containing protein [Rhodocyclaceae bacterium]|nr:lytic transglycosylase domain-containing protein [Rhodocyclaceae bacterium]MCA3129459.1 lytic transglycosylase domain-containing protein [Rhodocyclaceae bacterium]MCA3848766.1 lytic transglycosylase domain-containing protein [Burkholderia sp.]